MEHSETVVCLIVNGLSGRVQNSVLIDRLFQGQIDLDGENDGDDGISRSNQKNEVTQCIWRVENKYYQADVPVLVRGLPVHAEVGADGRHPPGDQGSPKGTACPAAGGQQIGEGPAVSHGAIIYYGDEAAFSTKEGQGCEMLPAGLEEAFSCSCDQPDQVRLLIMESSPCEATKERLLNWALENGTELIDLTPSPADAAEEANINEPDSVSRVVEALEAHAWPCSSANPSKSKRVVGGNQSSMADEARGAESAMGFEALMAKLSAFKRTAGCIDDEQRKAFAEKMAMEFYRCIGDDDDCSEDENVPEAGSQKCTE